MYINWKNFYSTIKSNDWPECQTFDELKNMPDYIQQEILLQHLGFLFKHNDNDNTSEMIVLANTAAEVEKLCIDSKYDYFLDDAELPLTETVSFKDIDIHYHPTMECGGIIRAPLFVKALSLLAPNKIFDHCLEWCSGPGFIGFNMLAEGLCKNLDLADIWKPSLRAADAVKHSYNVKTHHIRRLSDIPKSQKYDLIVGNPPWLPGNLLHTSRLTSDPGLEILKLFLSDVKNYLRKDGLIILVEGIAYTGPADFMNIVDQADLKITHILDNNDNWHWFLAIQHKD